MLENFKDDCVLVNEIILRNSGYSDFKNQTLPEGKGSITAIFSNYYDDFQLYIRDTNDVDLNEVRCNYSNAFVPTITLNEVRKLYNGAVFEFGISTNYVVEGYVISSDEQGNFEHKLVIQDAVENPTSGIQILIENDAAFETFPVGAKVFVKLNKLYMTENEGVLSVGIPKGTKIIEIPEDEIGNYIYNSGEISEIIPKEITISETTNEVFENTLVKVVNVQLIENELGSAFTFFSGENDGIRTLETCNETTKLSVFTNGRASFANSLFPEGKGSVTGVLSSNIEIRTIDDISFPDAHEVCQIIVPKIMITEIADPKNSVGARFVELYNAGDTSINLTGWKLNKYINGATSVSSSPVLLNGIEMAAGSFVIVANTDYEAIFSLQPTIVSTYISGNGDDVYELADNTGTTIDIFGVIGEDGNDSNWEYLDGRAVRNLTIQNPNNVFTISEWTVYSDASNNLISNPNSPKNAPLDYNPNYR